MKKTFIFIFSMVLFISNPFSYAQTTVRLSKPRLELKDNKISIFYDILNSKQTDKFRIWVEITDTTGNRINAHSLTGDIGENVTGGLNKKITWNLTADSIFLDAGIYIQLNAVPLATVATTQKAKPVRNISRGAVIFESLLFPGWGLSRVNKGAPHWLKGMVSYGCIAAAVIYNKKAISSYNDYLKANNETDTQTFYNNSLKEDNLSEIFAYTAIGIWVTDFIWTVAGSSKLKNVPEYSQAKRFSINPVYEPLTRTHMVAFIYKF